MPELRARLEALRAEFTGELDSEAVELGTDLEARGEDLTPSQHPADVATDLYARESTLGVQRALRRERDLVDDALARMAAGEYGRCLDCGRAIAIGRLRARPQAPRCVACEERWERQRARARSLAFTR